MDNILKREVATEPTVSENAPSDENELYREWRSLSERERLGVEGRLFREVLRHAQAVVCQRLHEWEPDLAQEIAFAVLRNISRFRGESKFSTWVHAIGRNRVCELIRNRRRWRRLFEQAALPEREGEQLEGGPTVVGEVGSASDFDTPILIDELCESLSKEEALLLRCKYEMMSSDETAKLLGIGQEAVDSRWARLKPSLQEILSLRRRQDGTSND